MALTVDDDAITMRIPFSLEQWGRFGFFAIVLMATSCPQQASSPTHVDAEGARAKAPVFTAHSGVSSGTAAGTAGPSPSGETSSTPASSEPPVLPPRDGAKGSTLGTISCGTTRCKAPDEGCGFDAGANVWTCQQGKDPQFPLYRKPTQETPFACDDSSDCPSGEACCIEWSNVSFEGHSCVLRADVNTNCLYEICHAESPACPKGRTCAANAEKRTEGLCYAEPGLPTCAGKKQCPASAPVCLITKSGLKCTKQGSPEYEAAGANERFLCTRPSDCNGGESCQTTFGESPDVATFCDSYNMSQRASLLCDPQNFTFCGKDKECLASFYCEHTKGDPAWLGYVRSKSP